MACIAPYSRQAVYSIHPILRILYLIFVMKSCLVNYALYLKNKFNISVSTLIVHTQYTHLMPSFIFCFTGSYSFMDTLYVYYSLHSALR